MNRRDTIIIAVLINAGLLSILFATAVSKEPQKEIPITFTQAIQKEEPITLLPPQPTKDEGDHALENFHKNSEPIASTPPPPPPTKPEGYIEVTVKRGDVLDRIARANHCSVNAIMELNQLNSTQLHIGQILKIPVHIDNTTPRTTEEYYTVQPGDNPWSIARKNNIKLSTLQTLNDLDESKARNLKPGDRLRLR